MSPTPAGPWARFDDLRRGEALLCPTPDRVLTATRPDEVADVLQEVHDATAAGSWAYGYVSYEAASGLDPELPGGSVPGQPPLIWFGLCAAPARVAPVSAGPESAEACDWRPDWTDAEHTQAVVAVRERIAAGETYQCNLTDRMRAMVPGDPEQFYSRLAIAQRGAYNAYLDLGRHVVASASPELFFEWAVPDVVRTRPMKGTAPRGRTTAEDAQQSQALRTSSKEQAENVMIVDLLRNDLGRVAEVGSVTVDELFALERYPTVWQLTSQISATLRPGTGLLELFRALFPCGSVTGAPKQRTMQLIRQLEPTPRGVYCGAVGLVAPPSAPFRARFSVAIRTAVVDCATGEAVYGVGGGITWGSDPVLERAELRAKAAVLVHESSDPQLLETMAFRRPMGLRNLDRHLARMADSADWIGYRLDRDLVLDRLRQALDGRIDPARVRVLLDRSGHVGVEVSDLPPAGAGPVRLAVDDDPVDESNPWLQHKTTRRGPYRTRALRYPHADDVVLVNQHGDVVETTIANLAVRLDGRWWTPPTSSGCLPGVERGRLLELGRLRERCLTVTELHAAEAIALVSSLRGWRTATVLDAPDPHAAPAGRSRPEPAGR